jgi:Na+-translocating ferredoxin:NAD+ oxidoreductase RnfD subunit
MFTPLIAIASSGFDTGVFLIRDAVDTSASSPVGRMVFSTHAQNLTISAAQNRENNRRYSAKVTGVI